MGEYIIAFGIPTIIIVLIREIGKIKRIDKLKELDNSTIESIGNYEKKSKIKLSNFNFWKKEKGVF